MAELRLAATVLVFRHNEYRILMVQRSRKMSFFPNAWVFPGGRVDGGPHLQAPVGRAHGQQERIEREARANF